MAEKLMNKKETKIHCSKLQRVVPASYCLSCARMQECLKEAFKNRTQFPSAHSEKRLGVGDEPGGQAP